MAQGFASLQVLEPGALGACCRLFVGTSPQSSVCNSSQCSEHGFALSQGKKKGKYESSSAAATAHLVKHVGSRGWWLQLLLPTLCCGCIPEPFIALTTDTSSPERWGHGVNSDDPSKATEWKKMPWAPWYKGSRPPEVCECPKIAVLALRASAFYPCGLQRDSRGAARAHGLGAIV